MKPSNISFGKIVKVYAPYEYTKQIADIANNKPTNRKLLKQDIHELFNDVDKGKARTFFFDKIMSFIFSGEESNEFWRIYNNKSKSEAEIREDVMHYIADNDLIAHSVDPTIKNKKLLSLNLIV